MRLALLLVFAGGFASAADPVVVELRDRATTATTVVAVGDVATLSGGDAVTRARVARLDLDDAPRTGSVTVTRRQVEFRLRIAGLPDDSFRVAGADAAVVSVAKKAVSAEQVVSAAKAALAKRVPEDSTVELVQQVAAKLPALPEGDEPTITAEPHSSHVGPGRVQMDVTIAVRGDRKLSLPVFLNVKPGPTTTQVLVRPQQRVVLIVKAGTLTVSAAGEAQQEGRLGQSVRVQNIDSKKVVTGKVIGPGQVEVELGGVP